MQEWLVFAGLFLLTGIVLAALLRLAVSEMTGQEIGAGDRMAGAMLAAVRIVLLAVVLVLIFDRIIPAGREPAFLAGSKLRPVLSAAGRQGLRSLPPDVTDAIDRLKRERGIYRASAALPDCRFPATICPRGTFQAAAVLHPQRGNQ